MPDVEAVDHKIIWDEVSFSTCYDYLGIQNGFVGVLDEANARNEFINPIHFKYITFSINEESMPDLAELIASTIKEARTTPEEMWVILSYWKSDGSGGGTNFKSTSLVPKVSQPINRNKSLRSRTRRKSNVIKKRMYSTLNSPLSKLCFAEYYKKRNVGVLSASSSIKGYYYSDASSTK